jgi:hypothetical protein
MTKLRIVSDRIKRAPIRCVDMVNRQAIMVLFAPWDAKQWVLPWSRLEAFSICPEGEAERIDLLFPHHHVIVVGENLREITDEIQEHEVVSMRNLPASHRAGLGPSAVFISKLEVRVLADPKSHSADGIPY